MEMEAREWRGRGRRPGGRGASDKDERRTRHPPASDQRPATSDQPVSMYRRYGRYLTHGLITILLFLLFPSILIFFFLLGSFFLLSLSVLK